MRGALAPCLQVAGTPAGAHRAFLSLQCTSPALPGSEVGAHPLRPILGLFPLFLVLCVTFPHLSLLVFCLSF